MRGLRYIVVLLVALFAVSVWAPASALANGCNSSAGDQQYVDPLQNCNPAPSSSGTHTNPAPSTSVPTPATTPTPIASTSSTTAVTATTATTHGSDPSSSKTLPYTGLNLGAALAVAMSLLGGGLVLRRLTAAREQT